MRVVSRADPTANSGGDDTVPLDHLLQKIKTFRSQGWINVFQERGYLQLLGHDERTDGEFFLVNDDAVQKVERELDLIERKKTTKSISTDSGGSGNKITDAADADDIGSTKENSPDNRIESGDINAASMSKKPLDANESNQQQRQLQFNPINMPEEIANKLDRKQMENLFVEMCFFARLGFLQPPTCLRCAYRAAGASREGTAINVSMKQCNRKILWRKDAKLPIHPDRMQSNSVIVACQTAQAWMDDGVVSDLRWDREAMVLSFEQ